MPEYYELMVINRRGERIDAGEDYTFKDMDDLDELARNVEIDSESEIVSTAVGIIRWLLKNDEAVKGKYVLKKKRKQMKALKKRRDIKGD